ncbi:MAG: bacterioferritin, partial [Rikenellaceae bacterium]|nr:bacterioferritin [Rikenellaceae bacterium]
MEQTSKYQRSIDRLNDALGKEISSTLQYIYFHTIFEDAGYE